MNTRLEIATRFLCSGAISDMQMALGKADTLIKLEAETFNPESATRRHFDLNSLKPNNEMTDAVCDVITNGGHNRTPPQTKEVFRGMAVDWLKAWQKEAKRIESSYKHAAHAAGENAARDEH